MLQNKEDKNETKKILKERNQRLYIHSQLSLNMTAKTESTRRKMQYPLKYLIQNEVLGLDSKIVVHFGYDKEYDQLDNTLSHLGKKCNERVLLENAALNVVGHSFDSLRKVTQDFV